MNPARYDSPETRTSSDDDFADRVHALAQKRIRELTDDGCELSAADRARIEEAARREIEVDDEMARLDY